VAKSLQSKQYMVSSLKRMLVRTQRTKHYSPITTDQALRSKHYCLSTTLQDGKNTDLEQSGGH
jgi:hypothetical protein